MSRIVLCTSSSGLDNLDVHTNIQLIRLRVYVNNVEFIDGRNIDIERLQRLMHGGAIAPVYTKPAPLNEVQNLFKSLKSQGYKDIFVCSVSSLLSESYNIIVEAAKSFKDSLNIHIYNCKELNFCESMLALEAESLLKKGVSMPDIAKRLDTLRQNHSTLYAIDNLSHLINNKKLSATSGFFANLFNIKPILTVTEDGLLVPAQRIRKFNNALKFVIDTLADDVKDKDSFAYIQSSGNTELDNYFVALMRKRINVTNLPIIPLSAVSVANHGPTGIALCVFKGQKPVGARYYS